MQEFPQAGGASSDRRAARPGRLFATFKLATPHVEMMRTRALRAAARGAANLNRAAAVAPEPKRPGYL